MLTACSKPDELIYYKTICEGYVYDATNNVPLKGVTIEMRNYFLSPAFGRLWHSDSVITNNNGYFQFRFLKSIGKEDYEIIFYDFNLADWGSSLIPYSDWSPCFFRYSLGDREHLYPSEFEGKNIFVLDTIKFIKVINN